MESLPETVDQLHSHEERSYSDSDSSDDDIIPLGSLFTMCDLASIPNKQKEIMSNERKQASKKQSKKKMVQDKQNDSCKEKHSTNNKQSLSSQKSQKPILSMRQKLSKIGRIPKNSVKKPQFQKNQVCSKVVSFVEWVDDSNEQFKVRVETEPYVHRQLKCLRSDLSDSLVPVIAKKTKLELGIKVISQSKEYLKIAWANVLEYTRLTTSDICNVFETLPEDITHEEIIEKFYISWRPFLMALLFYGNELDDKTLDLVLHKILPPQQEPLFNGNKHHRSRFQEVLEQFASENSKFLARLDRDNTCNKEYVKHLIRLVTSVTKSFDPVLHLLNRYFSDDAKNLIYLIESCKQTNPWAVQSLNAQCFQNVPLIPVTEELMGVITKLTREVSIDITTKALLELESHLVPNRIDGPWNSSEEFLNVHFRLLREECFASIRDRIASIRLGSYNYQRVFRDVKVVGYAISSGTIVVRIQYRPHTFRTNLMFGNLLCIDTDTNFSDPIWATVHSSEMRGTQLEICLIGVGDIYAENDDIGLPRAELFISAVQRLISCQSSVMIESPTYYNAFRPILLRLQNLSESEFPFSSEILLKSIEPQPSIVLKEKKVTEVEYETLGSCDFLNHRLDDSQKAAVKAALQNRFTLIQGPPGCGKTFVGKEIIKAMLQSKNFEGPILIMTYKNNALDNILEGCLEFTKSLVRIGGKSTSGKIAGYNLHNLFDQAKRFFPKEQFNHLQEAYSQLDNFKNELGNATNQLSNDFNAEALFHLLQWRGTIGQQQLHSLLSKNFTANYGKYINQKLEYSSPHEEIQAVRDILQAPTTAINLLRIALRQWLSESESVQFLPKSQQSLFCSNARPSKKSNDENADEEFEEEEWEEAYAERCVGSTKTLEFQKIVKRKKPYAKLQDCMAYLEPDRREQVVREATDVWSLTIEGRYLLLTYWIRQWREEKNEHLAKCWDRYRRFNQQIQQLEEERNVNFLQSRDLIACTITGCCLRMGVISRVAPSVVIVEEAAEILESQLIAALPSSVQHLVLIGDHRQLPPQVHHHRLARHFNLGVSIFERLAKNGYPVSQLRYHRRGLENLCPLFSRFYDQEIIPTRINFKLPEILKDLGNMFWWTHNSPARSPNGTSFENEFEAAMLVGAVRLLIELGDIEASKISIITAYLGQAKKIKELLAKAMIENVTVCTVDRFQGDENDYVFLSLTRSASEESENRKPSIGFLGLPNRACVALSRARRGLYIFGCSSLFQAHETWQKTVEYFRSKNKLGRELQFFISGKSLIFDHPDDFAKLFKSIALESEESKIQMNNLLAKELPTKAREGIHNVTEEFGRKIERLMNKSVLNRRDLGQGRDADGSKFNGFKVTKVKRIFNKDMFLLYMHHLKMIERSNPPPLGFEVDSKADWLDKMMVKTSRVNETFLFHGTTKADIADTIAKTGFDERVASMGGMYGAGIYFAENADKSDQYTSGPTHIMFLARVILGNPFKTTNATNGLRRPPPIDEKKPTKLYDSVVAVSGRKTGLSAASMRHQEFIVYDRYQCLPVFIIEYKRI